MMRMREAFAGTMGSPAALSYHSALPVVVHALGNIAIPATGRLSERKQDQKPWLGSAPTTTYAKYGKRPGAEVGHQHCDADHTNSINAGRNV